MQTDALEWMLDDGTISDEWGCPTCRGEYDCSIQPPKIRHEDNCRIEVARAQLKELVAENARLREELQSYHEEDEDDTGITDTPEYIAGLEGYKE